MATIQALQAREILDSRGLPTVECTLWLNTGQVVISSVSTTTKPGKYEAVELRDSDPDHMVGMGVQKAVENINFLIAPALIGRDPVKQTEADQALIDLDGTHNKSTLGANAILAVSQAVLQAGALSVNMAPYYYIQQKYQLTDVLSIPTCIFSMLNGGAHGADNLDLKDFLIIPASHLEYPTALNVAVTVFRKLEEVLINKDAIHCFGHVGGFAPNLYTNTDALEILLETIKATPYTFAQDLFFGLDMSAKDFFENGKYRLKDKPQPFTAREMLDFYQSIRTTHQVLYLEDPFQEDDWKSWQLLTAELGDTTRIAGDQLLVARKEKVERAIQEKACNSIVIKPNQVGTVSETVEVVQIAKNAGWQVIVSNRSGETNDDFLADFAVGIGADYAKFGAPNRGERVAKYNRLLEIYQQLHPVQPATV